ncbi:MAG: hypothetical protein O2927_00875 [Planctomycetota bacterium]|nr:hypothetical protein [Planctomycetota bacterium]
MTSILTGLCERPLVPVLLLGLAAAGLGWVAVARDDRRLLTAAVAVATLAALLVATAWMVSTPGERAEGLVDRFVDAAERADFDGPDGMFALLADDASLHFGKETNPGLGIDRLQRALETLGRRHRIRDNTVLSRSGETVDGDRGRVALFCRTVTESSMGSPVLTRWVFVAAPDPADGEMRIRQVVFETVGNRPADPDILR